MKNLNTKAIEILSTLNLNSVSVQDVKMQSLIEQMDRNNPWSESNDVFTSAPLVAVDYDKQNELKENEIISFDSIV
jgi:hypothetical protein